MGRINIVLGVESADVYDRVQGELLALALKLAGNLWLLFVIHVSEIIMICHMDWFSSYPKSESSQPAEGHGAYLFEVCSASRNHFLPRAGAVHIALCLPQASGWTTDACVRPSSLQSGPIGRFFEWEC